MREKRARRARMKIRAVSVLPRLILVRSNTSLYAQLVDDIKHLTLCAAGVKEKNTQAARKLGSEMSKKLVKLNKKAVVFDRSGRTYHGVVKTFVDAVREGGVQI